MLCYSACPEYGLDSKFIGPAAITGPPLQPFDSRDGGRDECRSDRIRSGRLEVLLRWSLFEACSKHVDPAGALQQVKVATTDWYKEHLMPWVKMKANLTSAPFQRPLVAGAASLCALHGARSDLHLHRRTSASLI